MIRDAVLTARVLFEDIVDIHSEKSLKEIARRYLMNKKLLLTLGPKIYWEG